MLPEQATKVTGVVVNSEQAFDQRGDPLRGPKFVRVAVRPCPLAKRLQQRAPLRGAQSRSWTWQSPTSGARIAPSQHRTRGAPHDLGDVGQRHSLRQ